MRRLIVFAGQGTQQLGMLQKVLTPLTAATVDLASQIVGADLKEIATTNSKNLMNQTNITQPLLLLSHYLHFEASKIALSGEDFMIGHSLGEYSALVCSGALSLQDGLRLVKLRGELMMKHTLVPHGMVIVKASPANKQSMETIALSHNLQFACLNSPTSVILAGRLADIAKAKVDFRLHKIGFVELPVSTAFHCRMLEPMKNQFLDALKGVQFKLPKCKVLRNIDCAPIRSEQDIREGLMKHLTQPVHFEQSVRSVPLDVALIQIGHKEFVSKFVQQTRSTM